MTGDVRVAPVVDCNSSPSTVLFPAEGNTPKTVTPSASFPKLFTIVCETSTFCSLAFSLTFIVVFSSSTAVFVWSPTVTVFVVTKSDGATIFTFCDDSPVSPVAAFV